MSLKALFDAEDSMEVGRTLVYKFEQIQSGLFSIIYRFIYNNFISDKYTIGG